MSEIGSIYKKNRKYMIGLGEGNFIVHSKKKGLHVATKKDYRKICLEVPLATLAISWGVSPTQIDEIFYRNVKKPEKEVKTPRGWADSILREKHEICLDPDELSNILEDTESFQEFIFGEK